MSADPTPPSPTQHPTGQLDVEAIRARHVPKPDEGFGQWCDWCENDWPCEKALLIADLDAARADRDVLAAIGQMYLAALDEDPENEYLSLPDAIGVSMVREAVARAAGEPRSALLADLDAAREELRRVERERDELRQHILDIDAHATPFGDLPEDPGYVGTYLLTAGALHRALGKVGHSSPKCAAEAERDRMRPVVEAARAWRHWPVAGWRLAENGGKALVAAVDTYETQTGGTE